MLDTDRGDMMGGSDDMINLKQFLVRSGSDKVNLAWICVKKYYDRMEVREGIIVSMLDKIEISIFRTK